MSSGRLSWFPVFCAALVVTVQAPARAGDPSPSELVNLAPVIDSSDRDCQSIDVSGLMGNDRDPAGPRLRFRALYRAPDQFALLLSDVADGTPFVFCSGKKMIVYDPLTPTVVYSEVAGFTLDLVSTTTELKFQYLYLLRTQRPHHILLNLRSVLLSPSGEGEAAPINSFKDQVTKRGADRYELFRSVEREPYLKIDVDLAKKCPYTAFTIFGQGSPYLRLDRLVLNGAIEDEAFSFPAKGILDKALPLKDVTVCTKREELVDMAAVVARASVARAVVNRSGSLELLNSPGLTNVDWDRLKENDKRFAATLRGLVPPGLRTR